MEFPLSRMLHNQTLKVTESGMLSFQVGSKTVGTAAVELFSGSQALSGRKKMIIMADNDIYIGGNTVTAATGFPVMPGYENRFELKFDPTSPVSIYAIATTSGVSVRIWEES